MREPNLSSCGGRSASATLGRRARRRGRPSVQNPSVRLRTPALRPHRRVRLRPPPHCWTPRPRIAPYSTAPTPTSSNIGRARERTRSRPVRDSGVSLTRRSRTLRQPAKEDPPGRPPGVERSARSPSCGLSNLKNVSSGRSGEEERDRSYRSAHGPRLRHEDGACSLHREGRRPRD